jgi:hypothetical protein
MKITRHARIVTRRLGAALGACLLACTNALEPAPSLVGQWSTRAEALSPVGSQQYYLHLQVDGRFSAEVRRFGTVPGQESGELSTYSRTVGSYFPRGDRLLFRADSLTANGTAREGLKEPDGFDAPFPGRSVSDGIQYTLRGDELTLHFVSYADNVPVPGRLVYRRGR